MAASSTIRSVTKLTRRPAATLMTSLWSWTRTCHMSAAAVEEELEKRISDKQAKVEATLYLEGMEASELKSLLPLVQQHLSVVMAREAVFKHLASEATEPVYKQVRVGHYAKVTFQGYEASELESLYACAEQHTSVPAPKENENVQLLFDVNFKERLRT
ncbi:hypothetical protein L1987_17958 [Smallanthus sonchifolius]|uniref:Uncharacterized protein n=1 Tax=Smallanthus sonchifolius TaxID=185202 RepID=A0ACB9IYY2_9ASTR|nr:hypothetical protein L1987_17958 [Smallanthus sonchifolius]